MKTFFAFLLFAVASSAAFVTPATRSACSALKAGYVPDGMTPEQWQKMKQNESADKAKKNFAAFGPISFKSRSLQSFQKELEQGKAGHLMPMMDAKEKLKAGKIRKEDIPYMQRGGSWDNSDVSTAKKIQWNDYDKQYENTEKKPFWAGTDWSGRNPRSGPAASAKKQQAPPKPQTKKLFGMW